MNGRVLRRGWWMMVALVIVAQATALCAETGTITISKCIIREKDEENEITSGFADADLSVYFESEASCSCGCEDLEYEWDFGDDETDTGKDVSHVYGTSGAGDRSITLNVECTKCGATASDSSLTVTAISGIEVQYVGEDDDNDRLCFNAVTSVLAIALPAGVSDDAHDLIDWSLQIGSYILDKANNCAPDMSLPEANWPTYNFAWGEITLYVSIDGPHVADQEDELITGAASFITASQTIEKFFDGGDGDSQNPSADPNWYYYYTDALSNGPHTYEAGVDYGVCHWATQPVHIHVGANGNDTHPRVPAMKYINLFNDIVAHESWHMSHRNHNYGSHGGTGTVPAANDGDQPYGDDVCDSGCAAGGWEAAEGTDPTTPTTHGTVNDREWIARSKEPHTDHSNVDWAHPGNQWE